MYRVEVPTTINRIIALFYRLRVWDRNEENFISVAILKLLQGINYVSFLILFTISAAISPDIHGAVLLTVFSILTHTFRMVYILWKQTEILQFIDEIGTHCTDDIDEYVRIKNKIDAILKFASVFVSACSGEAVLIIICPIFSKSNESIVDLAFPLEKSGFAFWITHIYVSVGCVYCIIWFLLTVITWYLMICCSCQYQLLGNQLRSLGKRDTEVKKLKACSTKQQLFVEDLIKAIKAHRKIHGTIEHFSSTFSVFFFIQIMTSSITICAGVRNLAFSQHDNLLEDIFNVFFSIYFLFDIFVLMYLGNEIELSSDRLSYCLFESNWIEQSPTMQRYIVIMIELLKRPQDMIIGKLYPLNLRTFMSIVNGSYSMFNVLRK